MINSFKGIIGFSIPFQSKGEGVKHRPLGAYIGVIPQFEGEDKPLA